MQLVVDEDPAVLAALEVIGFHEGLRQTKKPPIKVALS
jgi:hypothetical protein